jgi:hypothetical protein
MVSEVVSFHDDIHVVPSACVILLLYLSFEDSSSSVPASVEEGNLP